MVFYLFKDIFTHDINNIFNNIKSSAYLFNLLREQKNSEDKIEKVLKIMGSYGYTSFVFVAGKKVVFERKHHNMYYNVFFERM